MMLFHNIDTCYMADVIAIWETLVNILICFTGWCYCLLFFFPFCWQMLLPIVILHYDKQNEKHPYELILFVLGIMLK